MYIKLLIFTIVFLYLANWFQIHTFLRKIFKPSSRSKKIKDLWISQVIFKKTGLRINTIDLFDSDKPFGMMPGTPLKPGMILSTTLYKTFSKKELEWVILHEVGHCALWHNFKFGLAEIVIAGIGLLVIFITKASWSSALILGFLLSLVSVQFARILEREAEDFSVRRVSDPRGMITATRKLANAHDMQNRWFYLRRAFLGWNVLPKERISIAEAEIKNRQVSRR